MNSLWLALALVSQDGAATPTQTVPVPAVRSLESVPGVKITRNDISAQDAKIINKALKKQEALDARSQQLLTASVDWAVGAEMVKRTTGDKCVVTSAKPTFSAKATLPRLIDPQSIAPEDMPAWTAFLSKLESDSAAKLWFVHDRLPDFQGALVNKDCDQAMIDGAKARDKIRADFQAFHPAGAPAAATAAAPSSN